MVSQGAATELSSTVAARGAVATGHAPTQKKRILGPKRYNTWAISDIQLCPTGRKTNILAFRLCSAPKINLRERQTESILMHSAKFGLPQHYH
jgi:hypothetical protein